MSEHVQKLLSEMLIFSDLDANRLAEIAKAAEKCTYNANEVIIREGDLAAGFFLILEGQVEVQQRGKALRRMGRGHFFGETALVRNESRSADVIALQPTTCVKLEAAYLKELIQAYPEIAMRLLEERVKRDGSTARAAVTEDTVSGQEQQQSFKLEFAFESDLSKKVFENLVDSFIEDYMLKKFIADKCGWRNASEISRATGIPPSALYGKHGKLGSTLEEPVRRGLVESRYFPGERGRGGEVARFRIIYEKEPIKSYVNESIRTGRKANLDL